MEQFLQFTGPAIILLYLIVGANYISDIFGCQFQNLLTKNTLTKHILAFLTMLFFVVQTTSWSEDYPFQKIFLYSFSYYFIFALTTRIPYKFLIPVLFIFTILYGINIYKETLLKGNDAGQRPLDEVRNIYILQDIYKYQQMFLNFALLIIFLGFIIYFRNKQAFLGRKFSLTNFFSVTGKCKHNKDETIGIKKSMQNLFK